MEIYEPKALFNTLVISKLHGGNTIFGEKYLLLPDILHYLPFSLVSLHCGIWKPPSLMSRVCLQRWQQGVVSDSKSQL